MILEQEDIFYVLLAVLAVTLVYLYWMPEASDTHEMILRNQASVSRVRKPGETAVYRSLVAPHGRPLMNGLSVGHNFVTRPGNLSDIWQLGSKTSKILTVHTNPMGLTVDSLPNEKFISLVIKFGQWFQNLRGDVTDSTICLVLPNCQQSLVAIFAGALFNIPVSILPIDKDSLITIDKHIKASNPFVLILSEDVLLENLEIASLPNLKEIITIRDRFEMKYPSQVNTQTWKELVSTLESQAGDSFEFPAIDESETCFPLRITYEDPSGKIGISKFTHQNIAAAVASQIKVLPTSQQWNESDKVLIFTSQLSMFTVVSQLVAFVGKSSLVFLSKMNVVPEQLLLATKPTIMVTDDETTFSLLKQVQDLTLLPTINLAIRNSRVSRGRLPSGSVLPYLSTVRLIYSSTCIVDNTAPTEVDQDPDDDDKTHLNSADTNTIRALTGSRFIHALTSPLVAGPIASTHIYDYRLNSSHDKQSLTNYGPVAACIEAYLKDEPLNSGSTDSNEGRLFLRGFSSPALHEWIDTGIVGSFTPDGCFKIRN